MTSPTPARVIFVNRVYWPSEAATAQLLTDLAAGLATRGWEVHVIAAGDRPAERAGVRVHRTGGDESHRGRLSQALNYLRFLVSARTRLAALVRRGDVVVIQTDPPLLAAALTGLVRRHGAHPVQWIQDIYPEIVGAHAGRWLRPLLWPLAALRNRAWRHSARCVVVGGDMLPALIGRGVKPARAVLCPNWAPPELAVLAPDAAIADQRAAWGLASRFVAAYSGNLGRVHEFTTILGAAELLRDEREFAFVFVGGGPRWADVQAEVAARRLGNVLFFPAVPRDRLAASLAAADAHFVTLRPRFTGLVNPSKLAGVAAAGRPILFVGAPSGANPAFLARKECGYSFAPGESSALATCLRRLRAEPELAARLGANARSAYVRYFSAERALAAWASILGDAAADHLKES